MDARNSEPHTYSSWWGTTVLYMFLSSPAPVASVGVVRRSKQVPREYLRISDVQIAPMGSDVLVRGAVARLPQWFRNRYRLLL